MTAAPIDQRVRIALIEHIYAQATPPLLITLINAGLMAAAISFVGDPLYSMLWYGMVLLVTAIRFGLVRMYQSQAPKGLQVLNWAWPYALGGGLSSLVLGASVFFIPPDSLAYHVFVAFVLAGMVAGGVPVLAPFLPAYYLYLFPITIPLAGRMAELGSDLAFFMLAMIPLYILFMAINAKRYRDAIAESFSLRFTNEELVADLSEEKLRIEQLAEELTIEVEERRQIESELFVAKEHAESANIAKSQFLANMSHEIRTPMNGVIGMLQLLEDSELNEDQQACVNTANKSASSLLVLLNGILDFSKIESGR
ncbi:MAG: histidine kinase dimerization/phospho-acceptor domain-containing protein, partial [Gammaproteobacteria bacterium]